MDVSVIWNKLFQIHVQILPSVSKLFLTTLTDIHHFLPWLTVPLLLDHIVRLPIACLPPLVFHTPHHHWNKWLVLISLLLLLAHLPLAINKCYVKIVSLNNAFCKLIMSPFFFLSKRLTIFPFQCCRTFRESWFSS